MVESNELFSNWFNGYTEIDTVYGVKIRNGNEKVKSTSLKASLNKRSSIVINISSNNIKDSWKDYVKHHQRQSPIASETSLFLDIGIVIFQPKRKPTSLPSQVITSNSSTSAISTAKNSTSSNSKKRQKRDDSAHLIYYLSTS